MLSEEIMWSHFPNKKKWKQKCTIFYRKKNDVVLGSLLQTEFGWAKVESRGGETAAAESQVLQVAHVQFKYSCNRWAEADFAWYEVVEYFCVIFNSKHSLAGWFGLLRLG